MTGGTIVRRSARAGALALLLALPAAALAQDRAPRPVPFFESEAPLTMTLTANLDRLRRDREDGAPWRAATLTYTGDDGLPARMPLRARTRGIWRLRHCHFPPLRLDFWGDSTRGTPFARVNRPKLVNYCRDADRYEEYVLQELQLYRVYALLTPVSHRTRLLRLSYADSGSGKVRTTRWAFLMEEPDALAERIGAEPSEFEGMGPSDVDPYQHVLYAVFQYMIGNTDWSIGALHNAELYFRDGAYLSVAYDFDYAGAVSTEYAVPPPQLRLRDVRERRYRGYCVGDAHFPAVFALFNEKREAITALYHDEVGRLLRPATVKRTLEYFDEFYETINDPRRAREQVIERCVGGG